MYLKKQKKQKKKIPKPEKHEHNNDYRNMGPKSTQRQDTIERHATNRSFYVDPTELLSDDKEVPASISPPRVSKNILKKGARHIIQKSQQYSQSFHKGAINRKNNKNNKNNQNHQNIPPNDNYFYRTKSHRDRDESPQTAQHTYQQHQHQHQQHQAHQQQHQHQDRGSSVPPPAVLRNADSGGPVFPDRSYGNNNSSYETQQQQQQQQQEHQQQQQHSRGRMRSRSGGLKEEMEMDTYDRHMINRYGGASGGGGGGGTHQQHQQQHVRYSQGPPPGYEHYNQQQQPYNHQQLQVQRPPPGYMYSKNDMQRSKSLHVMRFLENNTGFNDDRMLQSQRQLQQQQQQQQASYFQNSDGLSSFGRAKTHRALAVEQGGMGGGIGGGGGGQMQQQSEPITNRTTQLTKEQMIEYAKKRLSKSSMSGGGKPGNENKERKFSYMDDEKEKEKEKEIQKSNNEIKDESELNQRGKINHGLKIKTNDVMSPVSYDNMTQIQGYPQTVPVNHMTHGRNSIGIHPQSVQQQQQQGGGVSGVSGGGAGESNDLERQLSDPWKYALMSQNEKYASNEYAQYALKMLAAGAMQQQQQQQQTSRAGGVGGGGGGSNVSSLQTPAMITAQTPHGKTSLDARVLEEKILALLSPANNNINDGSRFFKHKNQQQFPNYDKHRRHTQNSKQHRGSTGVTGGGGGGVGGGDPSVGDMNDDYGKIMDPKYALNRNNQMYSQGRSGSLSTAQSVLNRSPQSGAGAGAGGAGGVYMMKPMAMPGTGSPNLTAQQVFCLCFFLFFFYFVCVFFCTFCMLSHLLHSFLRFCGFR